MKLQILDSRAALGRIEPEWRDLYRRAKNASVFQSPSWVLPWLRHIAPTSPLRLMTLRRHDRLVALLPLFAYGEPLRLAVAGVGVSDYLDALVDDRASGVGPALYDGLDHLAREVECVELRDLPERSLLVRTHSTGVVERAPGAVCPRLKLSNDYAAYVGTLPKWLRRNLRQGEARLGKLGQVRYRQADARSAPELLERLFDLHTREWQARGEPGVLAEPNVQAFHRDAVPRLVERGELCLLALSLDERVIGVMHVLLGKRAYQYVSGVEPEFQRMSPGSLLIARAIAVAGEHGLDEYDFLRGQEPYKYAWGARDHQSFDVVLRRRGAARKVA